MAVLQPAVAVDNPVRELQIGMEVLEGEAAAALPTWERREGVTEVAGLTVGGLQQWRTTREIGGLTVGAIVTGGRMEGAIGATGPDAVLAHQKGVARRDEEGINVSGRS